MSHETTAEQDAALVAPDQHDTQAFGAPCPQDYLRMLKANSLVFDVKSIYQQDQFDAAGIRFWRL